MSKRRLTGATKGIAYGEDGATEIAFVSGDIPAPKYFDNAYNVDMDFSSDEIDTTAYGDYPWGASEAGFVDLSINLSLRHQVIDGDLAPDVEFLEEHCLSRTPFRIAIVDNRNTAKPNGWIVTVVAIKATSSGDMKSAQDHAYTLKRCDGVQPVKRISAGLAAPLVITS